MSELPKGWARASLGDLADEPEQCIPKADHSFAYIDIGAIDRTRKVIQNAQQMRGEDAPSRARKKIAAGDTLVSMTRPNLNAVALVPDALDGQIASTGFDVLRPRKGVDPRWLAYAVRTDDFVKSMSELVQGALYPAVRSKDVRGYLAPLAPSAEQTRIADQLDTLLARIQTCNDRLDAIPALLKRFRQAVLDAATLGELTSDWRESNGVDAEWQTLTLQDIADVIGGVTKDAKKQDFHDEEVPYLRVANVQRGFLDLREIKTIRVPPSKLGAMLLQRGDVLFNEGGDLDKLGRGWVWEEQIPRCTFQNHVFRARLRDPSNQPKFVSWWGNSRGLDYFLRSGKQTTNLASINKTVLSALPIALPSPREQAEIVCRVEALFKLADRIESCHVSAVKQAQRLAPLTMAKAFRGELLQQDPNDEPAAALLARFKAHKPPAADQTTRRAPKNPARRPTMSNNDKDALKAAILELKIDRFSFDELRAKVATDYESLKAALFELLEEPLPLVKQVFDKKVKAMRFVRVKP